MKNAYLVSWQNSALFFLSFTIFVYLLVRTRIPEVLSGVLGASGPAQNMRAVQYYNSYETPVSLTTSFFHAVMETASVEYQRYVQSCYSDYCQL